MLDYVIINPASTEMVRGSFCYSAYILYSALRKQRYKVRLLEEFVCSDMDNLPEAKQYLSALWSYPQIEPSLVLSRFLSGVRFFGYSPLIKSYRLPLYELSKQQICDGIMSGVHHQDEFKYMSLGDNDMHITKYSGDIYPLFTSYGCGNKCKFCPVSVNCDADRVVLQDDTVFGILDACRTKGYKNIHFGDEDFFFDTDRACRILSYADNDFNFIILASVGKTLAFIERYGTDIFSNSLRLIEIGLESADPELNKKMGKFGVDNYVKLATLTKNSSVDIFWLTMTFFPGETIGSLRGTGKFLEQYGFQLEELYPRIQTNSSPGGLGQFFQGYYGTPAYDALKDAGMILTTRPIRLLPSFVPNSFLECQISYKRKVTNAERQWFNLYRLGRDLVDNSLPMENKKIGEVLNSLSEDHSVQEVLTYLAICCRVGLIG